MHSHLDTNREIGLHSHKGTLVHFPEPLKASHLDWANYVTQMGENDYAIMKITDCFSLFFFVFFHLDVKYDSIYIFCYQINNAGRAGRVETTGLTRPPICICVHFVWCIRPTLTCECQCFPSAFFQRFTSRHQSAPTFTNWCFFIKVPDSKSLFFWTVAHCLTLSLSVSSLRTFYCC